MRSFRLGDMGLGVGMPRRAVIGRFGLRRVGIQIQIQIQRRGLLTQSWSVGPSEPPLLPHTIPQHFASIVSAHGDRIALIDRAKKTRLSYRELDETSNVIARGLRERGVRKGDRVAVSLGNSWEFGALTYAVFKLGAILVPLNPAFTAPQVVSALNHLEAAHLIISSETNLPFKSPRENVNLLRNLIVDLEAKTLRSEVIPSLRNIFLVDNSSGRINTSSFTSTTPFSSLLSDFETQKGREIIPDEELHKDDIINIQFTSGTTSLPKAACLTHHSILNNGYFIGQRMGLLPADIICCPPPLFHCFGSILGYMATATHGSCILFPSEAFSPLHTLLSIQEEKATGLYGVTTMFVSELELISSGQVPNTGFENLRTGIAAGSSVPRNLMEKLFDVFGMKGLTICYGMTETSPVSCMTTPHDPLEKRTDSVGRLMAHVEGRIVDVNDRTRVLPPGEKGELVVSGYCVMKHYYNDVDRTQEVRVVERIPTEGGHEEKVWMHTGDEAEMDEHGYVRITGRIKDLIIRGGENIHPLEVENCLFAMGEVSEVSVVGVPDERYGEVVAAFVVAHWGVRVGRDDRGNGDENVDAGSWDEAVGGNGGREGSEGSEGSEGKVKVLKKEDVRTWVRERLSSHLVPKWVFWVDAKEGYPKTASGKIQKFKLREMGVRWLEEKEVKM